MRGGWRGAEEGFYGIYELDCRVEEISMGEGTENRSWASDESTWSRHWASDEPPSGSIKGSLVGLGLQRFRLCLCQHRREACGGPLLAVGDLAIAEFHQAQLATGRLDHVDGKERAIDTLCHLFH